MNRYKEFEFLCGDEVWFRNHRDKNRQIVKGVITRVSLTERYDHWHYNLEASFEEYDWFNNDGRMMTSGIYLVNNEKEKKCFKSLEELNEYEKLSR